MTQNYVSRQVVIIPLPIPDGVEPIRFEASVLKFDKKSLDIGCFCYLKRKFGERNENRGATTCKVVMSSFSEERTWLVKALIRLFSDEIYGKRKQVASVFLQAVSFRKFMNWCDENGLLDTDCGLESFERALSGYVEYLRHTVLTNGKSVNTQTKTQNHVVSLLKSLFNAEHIGRGFNFLVASNAAYQSTDVPDESDQSKALAWQKAFFHGLTALVLENAKFPYKLEVPGYLNWPGNFVWVFPSTKWAMPPGEVPVRCSTILYDQGRGASPEEIIELYKNFGKSISRINATKLHRKFLKNINDANSDFRHKKRIQRAMNALSAFVELFIAETAMNPAQVYNLPWSVELDASINEPTVERQGFRSIKYRAGERVVNFEIGTNFLKEFRKFLKLRAYLLGGEKSDSLFFGINSLSGWSLTEFKTNKIYLTIKRFDRSFRHVSPRKWRAAKQDWAIRNADPTTAARLLQHSETTSLRNYSSGSQVTHQIEMAEFFRHVEQVVIDKSTSPVVGEENSIGFCISPDSPKSLTSGFGIEPACGQPEGCLFCDKFRVHADEYDIHKLLSCWCCINAIAGLAETEEQYKEFFGPILSRIEFILDEISKRLPSEVARLRKEVVEYGELTPYWQAKLEMLQELSLI